MPEPVRAAVEAEFGPVLKAETVPSGILPGLAVHLDSGDSRAFLKAVETDSPAAILYRRERWANRNLHDETPAPRLLWSATLHGWEIMLFEYVADCHLADLSPGSADMAPVLDTIALLGALLTPCPQGALSVSDNIAALQAKVRYLIARTPSELAERDLYVTALDQFSTEDLRGNTLLHFDLSDSNLLVTGRRVHVINWSFTTRGQAWVDAALFAPRLIQAGHTPHQADALLSTLPAWKAARPKAVAGLAALRTLFRLYQGEHGPKEFRAVHARAADAGRSWLIHHLTRI